MTENIFDQLNSHASLAEQKQLLQGYLTKQSDQPIAHPKQSEQIAYQIAGLLGTDFAQALADDHPYLKVLELAGELELPKKHRSAEATWEKMRQLVKELT